MSALQELREQADLLQHLPERQDVEHLRRLVVALILETERLEERVRDIERRELTP